METDKDDDDPAARRRARGAYFLQEKDNGSAIGDSETKAGVNVSGGIEDFATRTVTVKAELRYHGVASDSRGRDPSGVALPVGLKT